MRRAARFVLSAVALQSLLLFFASLGAIVHVRAAIAQGALEPPASCLAARDMETLRAGPDQDLADWWIWRRVYDYRIGENRGPGVGWRGALAFYGMKLGLSPAERMELAYDSMRPLGICGRPLEA